MAPRARCGGCKDEGFILSDEHKLDPLRPLRSSLYEDLDDPYSPEWMEGVLGVLRRSPLWRTRESVSVASGSLLEEVGYPLGIRRFEKDLYHVLSVRVPCGSDLPDCPIQIIVAAPQRDTAGPEQ
jgi:hypothetical protein